MIESLWKTALLFIVLMGLWLLLSGHYTPLLIALGVISAGFATWMSIRIGGADDQGLPLHLMKGLPFYLVWLVGGIILSNLATVKVIVFGGVRPRLFEIKTNLKTDAAVALYANSITLTPGTVTVDVKKNVFLVHALTEEMADDIKSDVMGSRVRAIDNLSKKPLKKRENNQ